ncbi:proline racemase [Spiroplasma chinense]|uniref:Proline racemase n=1 Tax=Spiroplasma chinense TaxID=216932 RepID=A0A5B9Y362_9MOLU|nr:proline racemase family protein [Spiroplasma chinense]QEH61401.1 proline racemase [Spiroplasma chinense]
MDLKKSAIYAVESHTEGEPTRIILSGVPPLKGKTMAEKKDSLLNEHDWFRKLLMNEPRGHNDMFGAIVVPPCDPNADFGVLYTESAGCLNMCGHGTIGLATVLIETGMVEKKEPYTEIKLDTPAGFVVAKANIKNDKLTSVSVENVASFLYKENIELDVPEVGHIKFDISFGGSFFILLESSQLNLDIVQENDALFVEKGMKILKYVNEHVKVEHPINTYINKVDLIEFYEKPNDRHKDNYSNCVVFGLGQFDRSPCGTGTSAKVATLVARNELELGQEFIYESILGTKFIGKALSKTKVGDFDAIMPEITGKAWITGFSNYVVQPDDPFQEGFNPKVK